MDGIDSDSEVRIPVFHIASMARAGETLLLRCLSEHPNLVITHNLNAEDKPHEVRLFEFLKTNDVKSIALDDPMIDGYDISAESRFILKQGTWEHAWPFNGFILARNPASIYASLRLYDIPEHGDDMDKNWCEQRLPRFLAWLRDIEPAIVNDFEKQSPIDQFCAFYSRRMGHLLTTGLPIFYYERFVVSPREEMERICEILDVPFVEDTLKTFKGDRALGHGGFDFSRSIDISSLMKYRDVLSREEFDIITAKTAATHRAYGYRMEWDSIDIKENISNIR